MTNDRCVNQMGRNSSKTRKNSCLENAMTEYLKRDPKGYSIISAITGKLSLTMATAS